VTPTPASTNTQTPTPTLPAGTGDTGWVSPAADNPTTGGDRNGFEVNPANAYADDALFAMDVDSGQNTTITCSPKKEDSHVFHNFSFTIPSGARIQGIEVRMDAWADSTESDPRLCVQLSWNGGASWSEQEMTLPLQTSEATYIVGGPAMLWEYDWTPAEFTGNNFHVRVISDASSPDRDFFLDWVAARVYYTNGP
jgi:hypothetical protein